MKNKEVKYRWNYEYSPEGIIQMIEDLKWDKIRMLYEVLPTKIYELQDWTIIYSEDYLVSQLKKVLLPKEDKDLMVIALNNRTKNVIETALNFISLEIIYEITKEYILKSKWTEEDYDYSFSRINKIWHLTKGRDLSKYKYGKDSIKMKKL